MRITRLLTTIALCVWGCTSDPVGPPKTESNTSAVGAEADAPSDKTPDDPTPVPEERIYPITIQLDSAQQARTQHLLTHGEALDAKCRDMLGDVAPVKTDANGTAVEYGCPRPDGDPKLWGTN